MTESLTGSPVFAGRYKFQTVGSEWDIGRSGYTHLVFDIQKERVGVLKRAEITSPKEVNRLKNEIAVLLDLRDINNQHVPEVYETGEAEHGSKTYFYMVIEYIEGVRVEKELYTLNRDERVDILIQLFRLLAKAHKMGIVNRDIDLKHLFWQRNKKQLIVIDWGNARSDVDAQSKDEFAYDMARSAEIIYSLVTRKGQPPISGSIALPKDSAILPDLLPIPDKFRVLCKWAPRVPTAGAETPYTAQEMLDASRDWQKTIHSRGRSKSKKWSYFLLVGVLLLAALIFLSLSPTSPLHAWIQPILSSLTPSIPPTALNTEPSTGINTIAPTETILASNTDTPTAAETLSFTPTLTPTTEPTYTPSPVSKPSVFIPILVSNITGLPKNDCWENDTNLLLSSKEGFSRRYDGNWRFGVDKGRSPEDYLRINFYPCLENFNKVNGIAANVWISRLELPRKSEAGREFGIFYEDINGKRREYTLWVDQNESLHLRVREVDQILSDTEVLVVNENIMKVDKSVTRPYATFPIQLFLEINNQGIDIIHLREGPLQEDVPVEQLDPKQMKTINETGTLSEIEKIGIIGYGGDTQTLIWPLAIFGE